jgi:hypothetical protein
MNTARSKTDTSLYRNSERYRSSGGYGSASEGVVSQMRVGGGFGGSGGLGAWGCWDSWCCSCSWHQRCNPICHGIAAMYPARAAFGRGEKIVLTSAKSRIGSAASITWLRRL